MTDAFQEARDRMVEEQLVARGIKDPRVLEVMRRAPRHLFLDASLWDRAYSDHALPIGEEQTISQPYMVAVMTEALALHGPERVLEVGTGSGYQTAVLADLASRVYSAERLSGHAEAAKHRLASLGYTHIEIQVRDGTLGWPEAAPFDAILVTAAAPEVPAVYLKQVRVGGRVVIPVGDRGTQTLKKVLKTEGGMHIEDLTTCVFVPLIGAYGWHRQAGNGKGPTPWKWRAWPRFG